MARRQLEFLLYGFPKSMKHNLPLRADSLNPAQNPAGNPQTAKYDQWHNLTIHRFATPRPAMHT